MHTKHTYKHTPMYICVNIFTHILSHMCSYIFTRGREILQSRTLPCLPFPSLIHMPAPKGPCVCTISRSHQCKCKPYRKINVIPFFTYEIRIFMTGLKGPCHIQTDGQAIWVPQKININLIIPDINMYELLCGNTKNWLMI